MAKTAGAARRAEVIASLPYILKKVRDLEIM